MDGNHDSAQFFIQFLCDSSPDWERVINATPWPLYPWERDLEPLVEEAG